MNGVVPLLILYAFVASIWATLSLTKHRRLFLNKLASIVITTQGINFMRDFFFNGNLCLSTELSLKLLILIIYKYPVVTSQGTQRVVIINASELKFR
jgi:hypothetical protein